MTKQESTTQDINKLIEFRQAIYENGMLARKDELFDVLDALLATGSVSSFAMLSQSEHFQRKWPSLYEGIENGKIDSAWVYQCMLELVDRHWVTPLLKWFRKTYFIGESMSINYSFVKVFGC